MQMKFNIYKLNELKTNGMTSLASMSAHDELKTNDITMTKNDDEMMIPDDWETSSLAQGDTIPPISSPSSYPPNHRPPLPPSRWPFRVRNGLFSQIEQKRKSRALVITKENAVLYPPPSLSRKGARHLDSAPDLWFRAMTGEVWDGNLKSYYNQKRRHHKWLPGRADAERANDKNRDRKGRARPANDSKRRACVKRHAFLLAWALTDHKLQGRTLPQLIMSIFKRDSPPWMDLAAFYVLVSRVRSSDSLRLLKYDPKGLDDVKSLTHNEYLVAWERGYTQDGVWRDALAKAALEDVRRTRKEAKAARAEAKKKETAAQRKAKSKLDPNDKPPPLTSSTPLMNQDMFDDAIMHMTTVGKSTHDECSGQQCKKGSGKMPMTDEQGGVVRHPEFPAPTRRKRPRGG